MEEKQIDAIAQKSQLTGTAIPLRRKIVNAIALRRKIVNAIPRSRFAIAQKSQLTTMAIA
ncbi:hypothetical protein VB620_02405 [Nodularia harveyana UHCC-0300]|uniref:Uncharacterized protein n=1 Tax=Nodularia harveyana UHCC-0300 TaxID=2974287 RepID=A0ABU5UA25_9CYAN|nr:hypothetical protein [Nodularia harveyana]MEA5580188.1 hypothetical protein [Nodularia harveyana UHCC-0300]